MRVKPTVLGVMTVRDLEGAARRTDIRAPSGRLRSVLARSELVTLTTLVPYLSSAQLRAICQRLGVAPAGSYGKLVDTLLDLDASRVQSQPIRRPTTGPLRSVEYPRPLGRATHPRVHLAPVRGPEVFLDIETDHRRRITVIGFASKDTGLVQLLGSDVTPARLRRELPRSGRLFTFNGRQFDLPVIEGHLGVALDRRFHHCDLRGACGAFGLRGGQKAIEAQLGFGRGTEGLGGWDAVRLWWRYRDGSDEARDQLLAYNADDVRGLEHIRMYLKKKHRFR